MDFQTVFTQVTKLSIFSIGLPIACCLIRFKTLNHSLRVLFLYLIMSAGIDAFSYALAKHHIDNLMLRHVFTVAEFTFISYFFILLFGTQKFKNIIFSFYIFYAAMALYILFFLGRYNKPDNILSTAEACFVIIFSFSYFFKAILNNPSRRIPLYYSWFISAFLMYFSLAFAIFVFSRRIEAGNELIYNRLYILHLLGSITYNILIAIGVWKSKTV